MLRPLKQSELRIKDTLTLNTFCLHIKADVTPLESALLSYLIASKATMGGYDWMEYIRRHKLEKHFKKEL